MRAARRLRRRLLGPHPREARIFFTPAIVATGLVVMWFFVGALAVGLDAETAARFLSESNGTFSIRTAFLLSVIALAALFLILLVGWLLEANRDGWDAYLPWRLTGGIWAAFVLAVVIVLFVSVIKAPDANSLH